MNRNTKKYGIYNWWAPIMRSSDEDNDYFDKLIHPDDLHEAIQLNPMGKVFYLEAESDEFITICYGETSLRVKISEIWHPVIGDGFLVGDKVNILENDRENTHKIGVIIEMIWHHKKHKPYYILTENEKILKKQYFSNDLSIIK